jgi:hypothetical protein
MDKFKKILLLVLIISIIAFITIAIKVPKTQYISINQTEYESK